jgi:DNA adenine methylase
VSRLSNTTFFNLDFQDFLSKVKPVELDFVFVDPPYDSDFTDYDSNEFRAKDQERLANTLSSLKSKVMIVIGDTELIRDLYKAPHWRIQEDQFTYKWTIKERNNRQKTHLTITNY